MSNNTPFFIHIGFHKTATTWFQDHFFSNHPQIQYLGKAYPDHPSFRMSELKETIVSEPDTTFSSDESRETLHSIINEHPLNGFRIHGMSYEGLSAGSNWFGGRTFYVADRLKEVFRDYDVKIIMGIREQLSMIESMYSEYVKLGGSESLERLLFSPFSEADDLLDKLKYAPLIEYYRDTFGEDDVFVYLFERFKSEKSTLLDEICDFLGIDPLDLNEETTNKKSNARLSRFGLESMRLANHFFFGPLNNLSPVTLSSYLLSHVFRSLDYNTDELRKNVEREHEEALRFEQDRRIQNQIRHHVNSLIKSVDKELFRGKDTFRYELDDETRSYLDDYYEEANQNLKNLLDRNLEQYGYSISNP
jgi:hypothetical protein